MRIMARAIVLYDGKLLVIRRDKTGDRFCTLPGGGVEPGETPAAAAVREVYEETSVRVRADRLLYTETSEHFGRTEYFLCSYVAGEPRLQADTEEARDHAAGSNRYWPEWLDSAAVAGAELRSPAIKAAVLDGLAQGWPPQPKTLHS